MWWTTIFITSSSSFYCPSVANAPNVLQPYWLIVLPLDVPDLTASLLLWGPSGQRWRCLWAFLFSNVPTFATSRLQEILAAKGGTTWARNDWWILPENARLPRNIQGSFTCHKSTTWDRQLYFPSEGRRAEDFFALNAYVVTSNVSLWMGSQYELFSSLIFLCYRAVECTIFHVEMCS